MCKTSVQNNQRKDIVQAKTGNSREVTVWTQKSSVSMSENIAIQLLFTLECICLL